MFHPGSQGFVASRSQSAIDCARWRLISPQGEVMQLAEHLALAGGATVARGDLLELLGHEVEHAESRSLDPTIKRMGREAMELSEEPLPIQKVQSLGFLLSAVRRR